MAKKKNFSVTTSYTNIYILNSKKKKTDFEKPFTFYLHVIHTLCNVYLHFIVKEYYLFSKKNSVKIYLYIKHHV